MIKFGMKSCLTTSKMAKFQSDNTTVSVAQSKDLLDWKLPGLTNHVQLLRAVLGQIYFLFFKKYFCIHTKKLHKMKLYFFFFVNLNKDHHCLNLSYTVLNYLYSDPQTYYRWYVRYWDCESADQIPKLQTVRNVQK